MSIRTINPATNETLREFRLHSDHDVESLVSEADGAFQSWRKTDLTERFEALKEFEEALLGAKQALAEQVSQEMGKTIADSIAEIEKSVSSCKTLREKFVEWKGHHEINLPTGHRVTREPLGVLLGIMPWNFPVWQVVRFVAPALLCGNTILMKHAPNTWGVAEFLDDLFAQTFPHAAYANLKVDVPWIPRLIEDRRVRGVSLTGSRRAGSSVGQHAGANLKKCVLELGGSDAYVILDDADLNQAAEICVKSRLLNAGQSCVAAKRFVVTQKNAAEFSELMRAGLASKKFGDPFDKASDFGPLARRDLRDQLHEQVTTSVSQGATLLTGGKIPDRPGFFYPPSLLTGVKPGQVAFEEELFGPVASIIEAEDEADAFRIANSSRYGLGGAVFSRDSERAAELARTEMEAGMVAVNDFVRSDVLAPFGGVKDSGLGRELGRDGSLEFTYIKTVMVKA